MHDSSAVYLVEAFYDIPKFEGFSYKNRISYFGRDSLSDNIGLYGVPESRDWKVPLLAPVWKPLEVFGRVRKFNDYPCMGMIPTYSERAVDALREFLEPNGELLPLISTLGEYFVYNLTTVVDALDLDRSDIKWATKPNASEIKRYEFIRERLEGQTIFRIPEEPSHTYVTEAFAAQVREQGLQGFHLIKVWPLGPDESWKEIEKEQLFEMEQQGLSKGKTVKGNTIVIMLRLAGDEATKAEQDRIEKLMDDLDAVLADTDSDAPAVGSLEGSDCVPGQYRLFLSCPDADELAKKLWPWLKSLDWKGEVKVVKRFGEYVDASAREEYVDLSSDEPGKSVAVRETPLSDEAREKIKADAERGREMLGLPHRAAMAKTQETIEQWIEDYRRRKHPKLNPEEAAEIIGAFWGQSLCNNFDWQWAMVNRCDQEFCGVVSLMRDCVVFPIDQIHTLMTNPEMRVNTREVHKMIKSKKIPPTKPKGYLILSTPLPSMQPIVPP